MLLLHACLNEASDRVEKLLQMGVQPSLELFRFMAKSGVDPPYCLTDVLSYTPYHEEMEGLAVSNSSSDQAKRDPNSRDVGKWIEKVRNASEAGLGMLIDLKAGRLAQAG